MKQGGKVRAMQIHPASPEYVVVAQLNSDKFMAVVAMNDSTFLDELQNKFRAHTQAQGKKVNLQPLSSSSTLPALDASSQESSASDSVGTAVVRGSAMNPQSPEKCFRLHARKSHCRNESRYQ